MDSTHEWPVRDRDLQDDRLKLVRYKVLFVKREYEHAFPEREDLVPDNLDGAAFTAWKIAEFIQDLYKEDTPVPEKWIKRRYPADLSDEYVRTVTRSDGRKQYYLRGLDHDDKKYLRIYYEVLDRYAREKFKYEEQQIDVLREIRDKIPSKPDGGSGGPGGGGGGGTGSGGAATSGAPVAASATASVSVPGTPTVTTSVSYPPAGGSGTTGGSGTSGSGGSSSTGQTGVS